MRRALCHLTAGRRASAHWLIESAPLMDLLEYQGKQLFARHGIPVPDGRPARTVDEAVAAAKEIGFPCVVKAQVQIGGRGKAGGIKLAENDDEARGHADAILGMDIRGFTVHEVWIEGASEIAAEYYASIVFDRCAKQPLIMLSTQGGMDIEEVAEEDPDAIATLHVDPLLGFQDFHGRRLAFEAGVDADLVRPIGAFLHRLYGAFVAEEAMLVEVNPLIVTPDREVRALDAKVTLDDNALFRHPDNAELRDPSAEDPQEQMAKERGLTYVKLDGDIGILGNGAGLVMSTLDVVAQDGGEPANFLDAGGGSKAEAITSAVEVILSNPQGQGRAVQHLRRHHALRRGRQRAGRGVQPDQARRCPFVVRLDGTNDEEGRRILAEADLPNVHTATTMNEAAEKVVELAAMSVLVDNDTRLCVSGITGREGTFHALNNRRYGTHVVVRRDAGQGRPGRRGRPGLQHVPRGGRARPGANTAMVFVPPRFAADSILEAADAGHRDDRRHHRGHPRPRRAARLQPPRQAHPGTRLIGPNCPGVLSPGKANVGIIPAAFFKEGNVGVVSRSGTLTYQIGNEIAQRGFGNSSIVGIGGDPVPGSSFIDIIALFEADAETELIVMSGEIGGSAEEEAAEYIAEHVTKPVVGLHRRLHGAAGQDDGPRRRDRLRLAGHRGGEGRGARGRAACASAARRPRSPRSPSRSCGG